VARQDGFRAVAVERIPDDLLDWGAARHGLNLDRLPTVQVENPEDPSLGSAVLSWRWDRSTYEGRSRNVALALMHARRIGVRHLFFDYVTIDQNQPTELLLQDVAALSRLYSRIPVIAAYDQKEGGVAQWPQTLQRPWILYEIRSYSTNPTSVTHIGFWNEARDLSFENQIWNYKRVGYANVAMQIMQGSVEMASIGDFRLILPPFEKVFSAAAKAFNRADYLLAVFLLAAADENPQTVERDGRQVDYGLRLNVADPSLEKMGLERFSSADSDAPGGSYEMVTNICLDGRPVAICRSKMTSSFNRVWIKPLPDIAERVFHSVGLGPTDLAEFTGSQEARRAALYVDQTTPMPKVSEVVAVVPENAWSTDIPSPRGCSVGFTPRKWGDTRRNESKRDPSSS